MSVIAQALNTFSNYLSNEAEKKKKESLFYRDYFQKQMSAQNAIENIKESGLLPKDYNINSNIDPTYTLENIQGLIGLQDKQRQRTKEDFILDNQIKQAELQKFLTNNGLVRQGGQILYNQFDDNGKLLSSGPVKDASQIDPRLADTYNNLQNQIIDDKKQADQLNWNRSEIKRNTPKFTNFVIEGEEEPRSGYIIGTQLFDPQGNPIMKDYTLVNKSYVNDSTKSITNSIKFSKEYQKKAYYSAKQIVSSFAALGETAKEYIDKFKTSENGQPDYLSIYNKIKSGEAFEEAGLDEDEIEKFKYKKDGKEITEDVYLPKKFFYENESAYRSADEYQKKSKFHELLADRGLSENDFQDLYKEYNLRYPADKEFELKSNYEKLKIFLEKFTTPNKNNATNQSNNTGKVKIIM